MTRLPALFLPCARRMGGARRRTTAPTPLRREWSASIGIRSTGGQCRPRASCCPANGDRSTKIVPTMMRKAVDPLDVDPSRQSHAHGRHGVRRGVPRLRGLHPWRHLGIDVLRPSSLGITAPATKLNSEGGTRQTCLSMALDLSQAVHVRWDGAPPHYPLTVVAEFG